MRASEVGRLPSCQRAARGSPRALCSFVVWLVLGCGSNVEPKIQRHDSLLASTPSTESFSHPCELISAQASATLQRALEGAVAQNHGYGGGVLRIESERCGVLWERASGNVAYGGVRLNEADTFEVASVTKVFTATCVLRLAEEGRLELDAPVRTLLPRAPIDRLFTIYGANIGSEVTVRQLLGHTSGLPDYWTDPPHDGNGMNPFLAAFVQEPGRFWNPERILHYAGTLAPVGEPGASYHYSDTGYVLLGLLVEHLTGKNLHDVFREWIFSPLGMTDTYLSYYERPRAGISESHRYEETLDLHGERRQSADWGGGGLVSSTRDLSRFLLALASGKLFHRRSTLGRMMAWHATDTQNVDYGLGLFRIRLDGGQGELWGHDGHGNAFMYYWPERELAFVGTLNQTDNDWWDPVASALSLLGSPR